LRGDDLIITRTYNYKKYGFKIGLLHIYLENGDTDSIEEKIVKINGISCVSIHIGNSDIVARYACRNSQELLALIAEIKKIHGVLRIVRSEQVRELRDVDKPIQF
jgi:hypothetical protein